MVVIGEKIMSRPLIYDKPMTKAEQDRRYKTKMKVWKDRNYLTFCFHLPKKLLEDFREETRLNGDVQRQLVIDMIENYINNNRKRLGVNKNENK